MNYIKKTKKTWDDIAESFDKTRQKPWKEVVEFIDTIPETSNVLVLGCGNARHIIPCIKRCSRVVGVDISIELLKIAKENINKVSDENYVLLNADNTQLPLKNETFDVVLYIASIHNIPGRENRLKSLFEVKRVLKNKGVAYISVWTRVQEKFRDFFEKQANKINSDSEFGDINVYWQQDGLNIPRFYHLYDKEEFIKDLETAGFNIIDFKETKMVSKLYPDNYFANVKKSS